ncbi:hypothetical protein NDU88_011190 [Pleurodeles waltl]|uniref:Secreted protein n=1 Tax=Pleurodeles waltl TaxID=8319 RepID=A0AAV7R0Q0_PLEWA|nr:hypothetical protein NDU88_011190 [Pleurodeles waltl]
MSRVCAWIFLLVFRLRVVLRGCASKFRSHGRRCIDFSLEVRRRCPCEAVRQSFDLTAGVASISPWKSGGVVLARPCVKVSVVTKASRRSASVCSVFIAAEQAVRQKFRRTERPSEKEKSFWS